jgi:hypothetical protein
MFSVSYYWHEISTKKICPPFFAIGVEAIKQLLKEDEKPPKKNRFLKDFSFQNKPDPKSCLRFSEKGQA